MLQRSPSKAQLGPSFKAWGGGVQSKSCPALCDPVGCSTRVLHYLLETVVLTIKLDPNKPGNLQDSNTKKTSMILTSDREGTL